MCHNAWRQESMIMSFHTIEAFVSTSVLLTYLSAKVLEKHPLPTTTLPTPPHTPGPSLFHVCSSTSNLSPSFKSSTNPVVPLTPFAQRKPPALFLYKIAYRSTSHFASTASHVTSKPVGREYTLPFFGAGAVSRRATAETVSVQGPDSLSPKRERAWKYQCVPGLVRLLSERLVGEKD